MLNGFYRPLLFSFHFRRSRSNSKVYRPSFSVLKCKQPVASNYAINQTRVSYDCHIALESFVRKAGHRAHFGSMTALLPDEICKLMINAQTTEVRVGLSTGGC